MCSNVKCVCRRVVRRPRQRHVSDVAGDCAVKTVTIHESPKPEKPCRRRLRR